MTRFEEQFLSTVPQRLTSMERHLEKIANCLERLTVVAEKMYGRLEDEEEKEDWLDHAHAAMDERFPKADSELKDTFVCEYWQNGKSDEWNFNQFREFIKENQ